ITKNNKTRREKLTSKNFNVAFVIQFIRQLYFRMILRNLDFTSDIGYYNNAMVTAIGCGATDIVVKSLYAKILHNKKSAHIFISNEAKYNQDCLNVKIKRNMAISLIDVLYSLVNTLWSLKGVKYEAGNSQDEQNKGVD
ncbi:MAG: hypothetical protein ACLRFE_00815, partial [Clostridia bacterium]